ncbi:hypothetical protein BLS_007043 [Venturia inaequalis]|uniref:Uncharacterized protein n=1 Tax=Venturia inaequalis TaxID=5025 RepID=A0A8H3UCV9_VENIN|nr:hypothetical protein BLS_007043 [Venturia inaequalis]RDI88376.1 hypothetical protein Vi05172_g1147 [Venturia inaequalis]
MASKSRSQILLTLLTLFSLMNLSLAASATSFCKCTCFGNSTIIQLDGTSPTTPKPSLLLTTREAAKAGRGTCNDCNRAFCKNYNLPICKEAKEEDILTACFQRDSAKDEAAVFIFIFATVGLLIYAAIRPWVEKWTQAVRERQSYIPISTAGADES